MATSALGYGTCILLESNSWSRRMREPAMPVSLSKLKLKLKSNKYTSTLKIASHGISQLRVGLTERSGTQLAVERWQGARALQDPDHLREAAKKTVDFFIKNGMAVGLGSGPGSCLAIEYMGEKLKEGKLRDITGVPMSSLSAVEAAKAGVPLSNLESTPKLDIAFTDADMAQEGTLYAIIGRRGVIGRESVVKEKEVSRAAEQFIFIVSASGFVEKLEGAVPVMIRQDSWLDTAEEVDDLFLGDAEVWRRPSQGEAGPLGGDFPLVTEEGCFVLDVLFTTPMSNPAEVAAALDSVPGVVGHGLFLDEAYAAAVAFEDGVKIRTSLFRQAFIPKES